MGTVINLQLQELPDDCYVFKHSTACPISTTAAEEVNAASYSLPLYWINVIEQRALSNWVAQAYNVVHESPQLLRIRGGKIDGTWSHRDVKKEVLA
jgi:bacillithiol system protein YtxJ